MKEYVRRVKATVEQSWMDDGEGGAEEAMKETRDETTTSAAAPSAQQTAS